MCLQIMTLSPVLNIRFLKYIIRLLLYLLVYNYQNLKIVSVLYIFIKFLQNRILIPIRLLCPKILIFMGLFYFRIPILMKLF